MPARKYTEEQKDRFFEVLDRGGAVGVAAAAAGVHPDAGYRWVRRAGLATSRAPARVYSQEEKGEFFRLLAVRGNVSAVARELGFVRVTCYKWAHQAGIFTGKSAGTQRGEFGRLRAAGMTRAQAAARVGVDKRSAQDWDKGIRVLYGVASTPTGGS